MQGSLRRRPSRLIQAARQPAKIARQRQGTVSAIGEPVASATAATLALASAQQYTVLARVARRSMRHWSIDRPRDVQPAIPARDAVGTGRIESAPAVPVAAGVIATTGARRWPRLPRAVLDPFLRARFCPSTRSPAPEGADISRVSSSRSFIWWIGSRLRGRKDDARDAGMRLPRPASRPFRAAQQHKGLLLLRADPRYSSSSPCSPAWLPRIATMTVLPHIQVLRRAGLHLGALLLLLGMSSLAIARDVRMNGVQQRWWRMPGSCAAAPAKGRGRFQAHLCKRRPRTRPGHQRRSAAATMPAPARRVGTASCRACSAKHASLSMLR